jgi:hypothetical protein
VLNYPNENIIANPEYDLAAGHQHCTPLCTASEPLTLHEDFISYQGHKRLTERDYHDGADE